MLLSIKSDISDLFNKFNNLLDNNSSEPFLWIVIFAVLLVIGLYGIAKFSNK